MSETENKDLFRKFVAVWETGNLSSLAEIIHENYIGHPSWGDRDLAGLRDRIVAFRHEYKNLRFKLEDQLAEGDRVASRMIATATRASDGRPVTLYGHNISRMAGGRIIEEWMAWEVQAAP